jgi:rubrerythrin
MATKKAVAKKTATKKTTAKKPAATITKKKKAFTKGDNYVCNVCGLVVSVDKACGCVESWELICCDKPMKAKKK